MGGADRQEHDLNSDHTEPPNPYEVLHHDKQLDMTNVGHPFTIGQRLVVIAEGGAFKMTDRLQEVPHTEVLAGLTFVELTITEHRAVGGDYQPNKGHYGYKAKGSDGWNYLCQWEKFDDCSMDPYANWHREYLPNVHYEPIQKDGRDAIGKWLIPESEFTDHYLNWDITRFRGIFPKVLVAPMVERVNTLFPNTQIEICQVEDKDGDGKPFNHSKYGPHYKSHPCFMCEMERRTTQLDPMPVKSV